MVCFMSKSVKCFGQNSRIPGRFLNLGTAADAAGYVDNCLRFLVFILIFFKSWIE